MNCDEALTLVEKVLKDQRLSKLQRTVFRYTWEEQSYQEIARQCGYELGYVKQAGSQLWQLLSRVLDEKVTKHNVQTVLKRQMEANWTLPSASPLPLFFPPRHDWGDAPASTTFLGRSTELATLEGWIRRDRCRLIGLFGMGGIGKTTLAVQLAQELVGKDEGGRMKDELGKPSTVNRQPSTPPNSPFQYLIWRSLRNAPPVQELLADLIRFLSHQQSLPLAEGLDGQIAQLLEYLRRDRCLIILDNGETVMRQGDLGGGYLLGYEGYGQLLRCVGEADHQSTVILTSREKPAGLAAKEGEGLPIRSLRLSGLSAAVGQKLLRVRGEFVASDAEWQTLVEHYAGNPLALKMVAAVIQELFEGQVREFLACLHEGTSVFGDIQDLLAQQCNRLSDLEQQVIDWLAIARKPIALNPLRSLFAPPVALGNLLEALTSLERRSLIEKSQSRFTLQPAVMEYVTERLIQRVCRVLQRPPSTPLPPPP